MNIEEGEKMSEDKKDPLNDDVLTNLANQLSLVFEGMNIKEARSIISRGGEVTLGVFDPIHGIRMVTKLDSGPEEE